MPKVLTLEHVTSIVQAIKTWTEALNETLPFYGIVNVPSSDVEEGGASPSALGSIVYNEGTNAFVFQSQGIYYDYFPQYNQYNDRDTKKVFEFVDNRYVWSGGKLVLYDALRTLDNVTPIATYEYDISSTAYFEILRRENTDIGNLSEFNDMAIFRVTVTGTNIYAVADCYYQTVMGLDWPELICHHRTRSTSAATTGLQYMRASYPKILNNGYPFVVEGKAYNGTARHVTVEVFFKSPTITFASALTASTTNSTYQSLSTLTLYGTRGLRSFRTVPVSVSASTTANYLNSYLTTWIGGTLPLAGEALTSQTLVFVGTDGDIYKASNKTIPVDPNVGLMLTGTSYNAGTTPTYAYLRQRYLWSNLAADTALTHTTLTRGQQVYLRCTLSNGNIYSDGYLATAVTSGYTWVHIGTAGSATEINLDMIGKPFITIDSDGNISHINGTPLGLPDALSYNDLLNEAGTKQGVITSQALNSWLNNRKTSIQNEVLDKVVRTGSTSSTPTIGAADMPVYVNKGVATAITSFPEAYLKWGGKNFAGSYGPIDAAMVNDLGANRWAFVPAAQITIEYTTDGGATWLDYDATDEQKIKLFCGLSSALSVGKTTVSASMTIDMKLRVTVRTGLSMGTGSNLYSTINKFVILTGCNGLTSGCYCTITARTQANLEADVDTWRTFADNVTVSGDSGYNVINISNLTTYGNSSSKGSQYAQIRFEFGFNKTPNYHFNVSKILAFGGVGWGVPSGMAARGHLYSWDYQQNATFPKQVNATDFKAGSVTLTGLNTKVSNLQTSVTNLSNLNESCKGIYGTQAKLQSAWPSPAKGDWAYVGETFPVTIYVCETAGTWKNSGQTWNGGNIDLTTYVKQTDMVHLTEEEYEALSDAEKNNGKWYFIEED